MYKQTEILKQIKRLPGRMLLLAAMMLVVSALQAQIRPIHVTGMVIDNQTNTPIAYKKVIIESDTAYHNFINYIYQETYTNEQGIYNLTIHTDDIENHFIVHLKDCHNERVDTNLVIFANEIAYTHYTLDFSVCRKDYGNCQPDFRAELVEVQPERYKYKFYDEFNDEIVTWHWNFGDGDTAVEQNPDHNYYEKGIYDVTLTVSNSFYPNMGCKDSITKQLTVGVSDYYHFGGHIFADNFPTDSAKVYLYKYDSNYLIPVDTTKIDTLGFYYFYAVEEGDYIVRACPSKNSVHYFDYAPTYYQSNLFWEDANMINLNSTSWVYDIHLMPVGGAMNGNGSINGRAIIVDSTDSNTPAIDASIMLMDQNNDEFYCFMTNETGEFDFTNVLEGNYLMYAEMAGATSTQHEIEIAAGNLHHNNMIIEIRYKQVPFDIDEHSGYLSLTTSPYPNPANSKAYLDLNIKKHTTFQMEVYDQVGRQVYRQEYTAGQGHKKLSLDISNYEKGIYFIRITTEDKRSFVEKLVKI
ncbi:MAG: T9SS type A sorting domain-containing protein [Bacteroidales bacterium]|nr:T9SS type A sorting domain-containing protein [Bacteroidales bacterium]MCF8350350.1 T9SS type A sorting domain-containing protein [Bacteroidales bacterium]MCF8376482.1 T9SS type A sorting domain-containing protein [Bacteroidales bacterium]MCF8401484.1 T9SS type A sorting domain-containing protein [Bacteroidales bacterium]